VVGFCGSFYAYEGLDLLVNAFPTILAARPSAKLLLVGGGEQEANLRKQVGEMGLGKNVVFTGRVPNTEIARYYSLIDVLAFPRVHMRLTELVTPLKPLEGMAMGRVVVASDVGGHRELVENGETGLLFTAGSREQLASAVVRVLNDPGLRSQLCANGRRFVEQERTWASSIARYSAVYDRALRRKGKSMLMAPSE
jgi:glycosyltransferase involved in cell wall biosynthesis